MALLSTGAVGVGRAVGHAETVVAAEALALAEQVVTCVWDTDAALFRGGNTGESRRARTFGAPVIVLLTKSIGSTRESARVLTLVLAANS